MYWFFYSIYRPLNSQMEKKKFTNWGCKSGKKAFELSSSIVKLLGVFWSHFLTYSNTPAAPFAGVNIGGAGSYVYDTPANNNQSCSAVDSAAKSEEKRAFAPKPPSKGGCGKTVSVKKKKHTVVAIFFFSCDD